MIKAKSCLYSQWFPGDENVIADSLSRDFHLPNNELTQLLTSVCPHQLPHGFEIKQLPNEIALWLTLQVRKQPKPMQSPTRPLWSKIALSAAGWNSVTVSTWETTSFSTLSQKKNDYGLLDASPKLCAKASLALTGLSNYQQAWLQRPSHMYLRPFGLTVGQTPHLMMTGNYPSFYITNTGATKTLIPLSDPKKL